MRRPTMLESLYYVFLLIDFPRTRFGQGALCRIVQQSLKSIEFLFHYFMNRLVLIINMTIRSSDIIMRIDAFALCKTRRIM